MVPSLIAITLLGAVGAFLAFALFLGRLHLRAPVPRVLLGLLALAGPVLAFTWACRLERRSELPDWKPVPLPEFYREVRPSPYVTDAGSPVPAFVALWQATAEDLAGVAQQQRAYQLITTAPPDSNSNCHGWVFTGGRFWIDREDVPRILDDNGYRPVTDPRPGDLIVYRIGGAVEHTGIVRSADSFGVLVESKWDRRGRYVHPPEFQSFPGDYTFYRSGRKGHILLSGDGTTDQVPALSWVTN